MCFFIYYVDGQFMILNMKRTLFYHRYISLVKQTYYILFYLLGTQKRSIVKQSYPMQKCSTTQKLNYTKGDVSLTWWNTSARKIIYITSYNQLPTTTLQDTLHTDIQSNFFSPQSGVVVLKTVMWTLLKTTRVAVNFTGDRASRRSSIS